MFFTSFGEQWTLFERISLRTAKVMLFLIFVIIPAKLDMKSRIFMCYMQLLLLDEFILSLNVNIMLHWFMIEIQKIIVLMFLNVLFICYLICYLNISLIEQH